MCVVFESLMLVVVPWARCLTTFSKWVFERAGPIPLFGMRHLPILLSFRLTLYDAAYLELARRRCLSLAALDNELLPPPRRT